MLYRVKQLHGYKLRETNGEIGDVREVYFDDLQWCVRYFVVETGIWLFGRKVLISPDAITGVDAVNKTIAVNLTREQVKNSPDVSTEAPISRQIEARLRQHYGWPAYWGGYYDEVSGLSYPFGVMLIEEPPEPTTAKAKVEQEIAARENQQIEESHLRSSKAVTGYQIAAKDDGIGHVDDFIVDDSSWRVRYIVVNTGGLLSDRKVLMAPEWIDSISWGDARVYVNLEKDVIANSPPYDPSLPVTHEYEEQLYSYYQKKGYWETTPKPS